jgi:dUTP pyrophosphatase
MAKIFLKEELKKILKINNINVNDYVPAYNGESAGLDLFSCSDDITLIPTHYKNVTNEKFYQQNKFKALISTGLRIIIPKGYVALVQERGSITKTPLKVRAGVVDSGYTGEIFINCINTGSKPYTLLKGEKLPFQIVVVKCDNQFEVVNEEEYLSLSSSSRRKEGMVGSSD